MDRTNWQQKTKWQKSEYDPLTSKTRDIKVVIDEREWVKVYCWDRITMVLQLMGYKMMSWNWECIWRVAKTCESSS